MRFVTKITLFFSLFLILIGIQSCFKSEEFPIEPVISNPEVTIIDDTAAILSFAFTDGDADLGLAPSDTNGIHAWGSYFYYNIYVTPLEKDDALGWVAQLDFGGNPFDWPYRIKPISVSENTEGIKGTMDIEMDNYRGPAGPQSDTMKFQIKIIDRALNESNVIETAEIISL